MAMDVDMLDVFEPVVLNDSGQSIDAKMGLVPINLSGRQPSTATTLSSSDTKLDILFTSKTPSPFSFSSFTKAPPRAPRSHYASNSSSCGSGSQSPSVFDFRDRREWTPPAYTSVYPDRLRGPGPIRSLTYLLEKKLVMDENGVNGGGFRHKEGGGDYRRHSGYQQGGGGGGGGGGFNNRKRRQRDDDRDDRPTRRNRYEEPIASRLRREILTIAEPPVQNHSEDTAQFGKRIADNFEDDQVRGPFLETIIDLVAEQPFKIPFIAAVILYANDGNAAVVTEILPKITARAQDAIETGNWREFKLLLRFLASVHDVFEGEGIFSLLDELFNRAADQQSVSQSDTLGLELVNIILYTLPYLVAYSKQDLNDRVQAILQKTEIVTSVPHPLEDLVETYPVDADNRPFGYASALDLLQKQLQQESADGWKLSCLPRIYQPSVKNGDEEMKEADQETTPKQHPFPTLTIPAIINPGQRPIFPETYYSMYADQDVETVPKTTNIASSIIRDTIADTINILHYNRLIAARYLIDLDCFFAPGTFAKRATAFDKIRDIPEGQSTWKPEDLIVDAVFAQMLSLPSAEQKLVYYHSVITESCKLAPSAIAPTLGRAIRFLYRSIDYMDLELTYRFLDWFAHHLSNFDFRWKWAEWIDDIEASNVSAKKAFIASVIDKEIRLSFANRIKDTLPMEYHKLIAEGKERDQPEYKYNRPDEPYGEQGKTIFQLLRKRAPDSEIQNSLEDIEATAAQSGSIEPIVESTIVYMTAVCAVGAKSMSHVLSCIERCKDRLLSIGTQSEAARRQIISAVVSYWVDFPGTAVNIVDKLLNYTIITPESVVRWCLDQNTHSPSDIATGLPDFWRYEMMAATMGKVTNRVRQIVAARVQASKSADLPEEQLAMIDDTLRTDREGMRALFRVTDELLTPFTDATYLATFLSGPEDVEHVARWAQRWARVFRRKAAVEETVVGEDAVSAAMVHAKEDWEREEKKRVEEEKIKQEEAEKRRAVREKEEEEERERLLRLEEEAGKGELDVADGD